MLALAPHLFDRPGDHLVRGVRVGAHVLDVVLRISDTSFAAEVRRVGGPPSALTLQFEPALAPEWGERSRNLEILGARLAGDGLELSLEGRAGGRYRLEVHRPSGRVANEIVQVPEGAGDARDGYARVAVRLRP